MKYNIKQQIAREKSDYSLGKQLQSLLNYAILYKYCCARREVWAMEIYYVN